MTAADSELYLKVYNLILSRHKDTIEAKENRSISEIRQMVSPYNEIVRGIRDRILANITSYEYEKDFPIALQAIIRYIQSIKRVDLPLHFWMNFDEIDSIGAAPLMEKAVLMAALLRSVEGENVLVYVTISNKYYVGLTWKNGIYLINPESGSMLGGEDVPKVFQEDKIKYAFSDLFFENLEETG